jgi:uncharacterized damage-inducible protein DinB
MELLDRLLGHDQWTTARCLELSRDLTDDLLDQPFDIGHRTLRATFAHMIYNVGFWTRLMLGETPGDHPESPSLAEMTEVHERTYPDFADLAHQLCEEGRLDKTFTDHYGITQTFGATIIQVILHNHQHRGDVLHILQRLGVPDLPDGDPQEWEHFTGQTPWRS